jgi:hypothetical protein
MVRKRRHVPAAVSACYNSGPLTVTGATTAPGANGIYAEEVGIYEGHPYYLDEIGNVVAWNDTYLRWVIGYFGGYSYVSDEAVAYPCQVTQWFLVVNEYDPLTTPENITVCGGVIPLS